MKFNVDKCIVSFLVVLLFLFACVEARASDRDRFTTKPGSVFCKSLAAMYSLQNSLAKRDGKAESLLKSQECAISQTPVVVYVVHEEKDLARVQLPESGKYFWTTKQSLH